MLVYGDATWVQSVGETIKVIERHLGLIGKTEHPLDRHAALIAAFITTSELVQGLADAELASRGVDARSESQDAGMRFLMALAGCVRVSWGSGFGRISTLPDIGELSGLDASLTINVKRAEGYAYYALYPESYLAAALRSGLGPDTYVIGIRSIGTGLAALVASALGARPPVTLRPGGHPFLRSLRVHTCLGEQVAGFRGAFAIVDEGPGLSGSSFSAVANWLESKGVARGRIHFFPSHSGDPGPQCSTATRELWHRAPRHVVTFDELLLAPEMPQHNLTGWLEIVGRRAGEAAGGYQRRSVAKTSVQPRGCVAGREHSTGTAQISHPNERRIFLSEIRGSRRNRQAEAATRTTASTGVVCPGSPRSATRLPRRKVAHRRVPRSTRRRSKLVAGADRRLSWISCARSTARRPARRFRRRTLSDGSLQCTHGTRGGRLRGA